MTEDQLFYVGQKALIEKDGKILVLHNNTIGADLPGGKIQVGELDFIASLKREVSEETGLTISSGSPFSTCYFTFLPANRSKKLTNFIFIVFFIAKYLSGEVKLSDEHESYQWISKKNYRQIDDRGGQLTAALEIYFNKK